MKTRILIIIMLTIAALCLLLGLKIGRKQSEPTVIEKVPADTLIAKRVFNLIILDESGSMNGIKDVSVCGVNETLQTIRVAYEEYPQQEQYVTFATFSGEPRREDNFCRVKRELQSISDVTELTIEEYIPNGSTPLWDAMGILLVKLEGQVSQDDLVLVTIITDGYENSSVNYTSEKIRKLVSRLDEKGWVFTYIGANQDAALAAGQMGIRNSYNYSSDNEGTRKMFEKERGYRTRFYRNSRVGYERNRLKDGYFKDDDKE